MANQIVCANCGAKIPEHEKPHGSATCAESGGEGHDWSDADPLSRLEALIANAAGAETINSEDNNEWQWVEIAIRDHDAVGESELIAGHAKREGFTFVGIGEEDDADDGPATLRFNRQKEQ